MPIYDESLATGVKSIDDQHKELFDKINNLLAACREGKGKEEVAKVMEFLSDYVIDHFTIEKGYMTTYSYPDYTSHMARHEEFIQGFADLKRRLETEGAAVSIVIGTNRLLGDWWINHINTMDKALGSFLKTKL